MRPISAVPVGSLKSMDEHDYQLPAGQDHKVVAIQRAIAGLFRDLDQQPATESFVQEYLVNLGHPRWCVPHAIGGLVASGSLTRDQHRDHCELVPTLALAELSGDD